MDMDKIALASLHMVAARMRGSDKVDAETREILTAALTEIQAAWDAMADAMHEVMGPLVESLRALAAVPVEDMKSWAEYGVDVELAEYWADLEREHLMQREAIPREQERAAARYKAHRAMMANVKARQHQRRRKYRSGANAGWF